MKYFALITLIFIFSKAIAQTDTELERVNFFPDTDAYLISSYGYEKLEIETPQSTVSTKKVNNYFNVINLSYAQRIHRSVFAGVGAHFIQSSENGVRYGLPIKKRFNSLGFREPDVYLIYRIRPQTNDKGVIDLNLSYSPKLGNREVGKSNANGLNGRNILKSILSHGLLEDDWEFKSAFGFTYYAEGEEKNSFTKKMYDLEKYWDLSFKFTSQHKLNNWLYAYGTVGVIYQTTQDVIERGGQTRELQAGTGSFFEVGMKKPLGKVSIIELIYNLKRNDYFVKGLSNNLEGKEVYQRFTFNYLMAF
jgi:hypothetical protein